MFVLLFYYEKYCNHCDFYSVLFPRSFRLHSELAPLLHSLDAFYLIFFIALYVLHRVFFRQGLTRDSQQKDRRARQQSRVRFSQVCWVKSQFFYILTVVIVTFIIFFFPFRLLFCRTIQHPASWHAISNIPHSAFSGAVGSGSERGAWKYDPRLVLFTVCPGVH